MKQEDWIQRVLERRPAGFDPYVEKHIDGEYSTWEPYTGQAEIDERNILPNEIVLDIDASTTDTARTETRKAVEYLEGEDIPFYVADTGGTGWHIHIFFHIPQFDTSSEYRPARIALFELLKDQLRDAGVDTALLDTGMAWFDENASKGKLVRAVGGKNLDTGHRKTLDPALEKQEVEEREEVKYPDSIETLTVSQGMVPGPVNLSDLEEKAEELQEKEQEEREQQRTATYESDEDGIDALRTIPAVEVLAALGHDVSAGEMVKCEGHDDTKPSLYVEEDATCWGSCGTPGRPEYKNAIDLVLDFTDKGFKEAVEWLSSEFGIEYELRTDLSPGKVRAAHVGQQVRLHGRIVSEKSRKAIPERILYYCRDCDASIHIDGTEFAEEFVFKGRKRMDTVLKEVGNRVFSGPCEENRDSHRLGWSVQDHTNYAVLWIEDLLEDMDKFDSSGASSIRAPVLREEIPNSRKVAVEGTVEVDPQSSDLVVIADGIEPLETEAENWESSQAILDDFTTYFEDTDRLPVNQIAPDLVGRDIVKEARLRVLHSPPAIPTLDGNATIRGYLREILFGDTKTGKSMSVKDVTGGRYEFGEWASAETGSRAGLVYTADTDRDTVKWGTIPLNDRGYVGLDGLNALHSEEMKQLREVLEDGRVKVNMAVTGEAPARVRISGALNPPNPMDQYLYSCTALQDTYIFEKTPDITRWDLFIPFRNDDVPQEEINNRERGDRPIPDDVFRNHVYWAWSRTPEDIRYTDDARERIKEKATNLTERFHLPSLPIVHNGIREVVMRLAVSDACLFHSTGDDHETVIVTEENVDQAVAFYRRVLDELEIEEYQQELEGELDVEEDFLAINKDLAEGHYDLLTALIDGAKSAKTLAEELDVSETTVKNRYEDLRKHDLIETSHGQGTMLSTKGVRFLRELKHGDLESGQADVDDTTAGSPDTVGEEEDANSTAEPGGTAVNSGLTTPDLKEAVEQAEARHDDSIAFPDAVAEEAGVDLDTAQQWLDEHEGEEVYKKGGGWKAI